MSARTLPNVPATASQGGDVSPRADYRVRAKVWLYPGKGGWHFANLSPKQSAAIKRRSSAKRVAWGSVPVRIRIGKTQWETSLFPDRKTGTYLFAIKADVRRAERIRSGDTITAFVAIR